MDSSVHGILQVRIQEWVAISSSRGSSAPRDPTQFPASSVLAGGFFTIKPPLSSVQSLSRVPLFVTPWTAACWVPLSMGFSRKEHRSGLPFPPPGDLPDPEIQAVFPALEGGFFTTNASWEAA